MYAKITRIGLLLLLFTLVINCLKQSMLQCYVMGLGAYKMVLMLLHWRLVHLYPSWWGCQMIT
ncbi:hypothetical protein KM92DES2_10638 [uncultured Desulfovibrio sp.]|uniref:Uncharacterized protein n=1 Tax=uncultured Desulfovibrio sp. TaxID=167968 RepID=A0A212J773_9BACT|nr:hypothetical protein KM92DES2_10638 [uncultured Desulfovibrio sp.]